MKSIISVKNLILNIERKYKISREKSSRI